MSTITIVMENPNEPPILSYDNERVSGIVSIDYHYETSTHDSLGVHTFNVKYVDIDSRTIKTATINRIIDEMNYPDRLKGSE